MTGLPKMPYGDGIRKSVQVKFGGYNHTAAAKDGQIYDMKNMSGEEYPLLSVRRKRHKVRTLTKPNGLYAQDGLCWVDGTGFYVNGVLKGSVADSRKRFASLGAYIVIMPDKVYYNRLTGEFGGMESVWTGSARIQDGLYAGEAAKANTIYAAGANWKSRFRVGDGVEIQGSSHAQNNKTSIIREIEGDFLRFYENVFVTTVGNENLTIRRSVPEMDFICENENRLWGCKGSMIYASKLGDIFNWNVFDGVATDSFAVTVGSAGDFTGCTRFLGYPCFFKEDLIYKVYGSKPSNFQVMNSASLGVMAGSSESIAIASEKMFYFSRAGIMVYSGGIPQEISKEFGEVAYKGAVAGSDGRRYFVSLKEAGGKSVLFVYDPRVGLWHKEDETEVVAFAYDKGLYFLDSRGNLWLSTRATEEQEGVPEDRLESMVEFADFEEASPNRKGTSKLQVRMELFPGAVVSIFMQFDSSGEWQKVKECRAERKRSFYIPIIPRRSDHYKIRFEAVGEWRLHSLTRENYTGSEL